MPTATAYAVHRAIFGTSDWVEVARVSAGKRSALSEGLQPGTRYAFRVTATLARGDEQVVAETSAITPPADL
jgi:hypothetical protein